MPRPGPRPYECVRRAWHSDSHQPIRGYLIQEVFRIANEVHSSAIKKNREWREKLPVVVLKAEEIMYSKANSEAEYADFDTLWERANDAIDTIIRRDETTETAELLQPCIEAALHLGCTPRRSSRSQRNSTPRSYLTPEKNEPETNGSSNMNDKDCFGGYPTNCSFMPGKLNLLPRNNAMYSSFSSEKTSMVIQENAGGYLKSPISHTPTVLHPSYLSNSCYVYPLYYGNQFQSESSNSKGHSHLMEADNASLMAAKLTSSSPDASNALSLANVDETYDNACGDGCDLSLRLGPSCQQELKCSVRVKSQGKSQPNSKKLPRVDIEGSSFLESSSFDMLDLSSIERDSRSQILNVEANLRRRKVAISIPKK